MSTVGATAMSPREAEVLDAVGAHLTNAQIAQKLNISVRTVESHVSSLLRKLGATDRRDLAAQAPALIAAAAPRARLPVIGLPARWTSFVGRAAELGELTDAVAAARLVTLVGPGGIGKTTLATVAAEQLAPSFDGGGAFVDLAPVRAEFVIQAVAAALAVVERPQEPLQDVVHDRLRMGRTLVVLDNCEHVLDAAAAFAQGALAACPSVVVLATSRERLGLAGERVVAVPPLALTGDRVTTSDAAALFLDRARSVGAPEGDPALVAEVCRRLDGVPLAIELAAARSASLGVDGLLAGLDDRLRLLSSGPTGRHQSLRAVIDWSHELLDAGERAMFRRLAVFAGAFDLTAAAEVAGAGDAAATSDLVGRLADKSLLAHRRGDDASRWRMLETVRAYALEQLEASGEGPAVRDRHLEWAAEAAVALEEQLVAGLAWQAPFDATADDLRAALAATAPEVDARRHRLALALGRLSYARRALVQARHHYDTAIASAPDSSAAVAALWAAADAAYAEMRGEVAFRLLLDASERARADGDAASAAMALADAVCIGARCPATFATPPGHDELVPLVAEAIALAPEGDQEVALHVTLAGAWSHRPEILQPDPELTEEALARARALDEPVAVSNALDAAASVAIAAGHHRLAYERTAERLTLLPRMARHDPRVGFEVADINHMVVEAALGAGELAEALDHARRAREDPLGRGLAHFAAAHLVPPYSLLGAFDDALAQAAIMHEAWTRSGRPAAGWMAPAFFATAMIHGLRGDGVQADEWSRRAEDLTRPIHPNAFRLFAGPRVALFLGDLDGAVAGALAEGGETIGLYHGYAETMAVEVAIAAGEPGGEARLARAMATVAPENDYLAAQLRRAAGRLHRDAAELASSVEAWERLGAHFERACTLLLLSDRAQEGRADLLALGCVPPTEQPIA